MPHPPKEFLETASGMTTRPALMQAASSSTDRLRVTVIFSRESVEVCDSAPILARIEPLAESRKAALYWAGTLTLYFEGWEQDPRELYAIPEVRAYFSALTAQWPYWWHYIEKDGEMFNLVLGLLCQGRPEQVGAHAVGWRLADADEIERTIQRLQQETRRLHARLKIAESMTQQIEQQISALVRGVLPVS